MRFSERIDFDALMEPVASNLLGKPNERLSRPPADVRYGTRGSLSIDFTRGSFRDYENNTSGGVIDLIKHKRGCDRAAAVSWMRRERILPEPPRPTDQVSPKPKDQPKIVAEYDYVDEAGLVLFQTVRHQPKDFRQRRRGADNAWIWNLDGVRRVLYRLPEVIATVAAGRTIFVVEGEKDADNLCALGFTATTNPMGANKWQPEYSELLRGADVVVVPDNDKAGHDHAAQVATFLTGIAKRVRVLDLAEHWPDCPDRGDISDWIITVGGSDSHKLTALIKASADWIKPHTDEADYEPKARLANFVFFGDVAPKPQIMLIDGVMPLQGLPFIGGQSSAGKTFVAILLACCAASGRPFMGREVRQRVGSVIVAAEGRSMLAARIAAALQKLGVTEPVPISWVKQVPDFSRAEAITEFVEDLRAISKRYLAEFGIPLGLVFVDTVSASFDIKEEADNAEAARVCKIMRAVADRAETLVVPIHHYGKNAGVGLRGASAWRANADFVLSVMADIDPQTGNVTNRQLAVAKDRDGAQGPLTPFELVGVDLGIDEDGKSWGSLAAVAGSSVSPSATLWPDHLRVFRQAMSNAMIDFGADQHPFADGPLVRAVSEDKVRAEFDRIAHVDSPPEKRQEALRKQFSRKLNDAQGRTLIGLRNDGAGQAVIWFVSGKEDAPDTKPVS